MRPRRARRPKIDEPNVPVAPMLDMAFQLLTFFVLTYRQAPQEGQFIMSLLPPSPATAMAAAPAAAESAPASSDLPASLRTLPTTLRAGDGGRLAQVVVETTEIPSDNKQALVQALLRYLQDPDLPFDQTLIKVDPNLKYSELMTVIDAFATAFEQAKKDPKISFDELDPNEGG
ncbi:Biopolymer transport protein ExbD/TolR [Aquisphaera giovannonii]|uniref:Biopolymer transport protein ExbD/TolR n=1 Tax=Aquisphaera giovannonii TaxID=406548 RepID=A0A5B9WBM5_9BACT|nr:biopolymer transporter ExbD [Aquisphaera giovannonii]QEH37435.1 Biopolymer transport protein ExbD/TolR [Aquisphaera giovannonii]